jgi:hypothetical protein
MHIGWEKYDLKRENKGVERWFEEKNYTFVLDSLDSA